MPLHDRILADGQKRVATSLTAALCVFTVGLVFVVDAVGTGSQSARYHNRGLLLMGCAGPIMAWPLVHFTIQDARRLRRKRCRRQALCCVCGYSLQANESGTCPECGHLVVD